MAARLRVDPGLAATALGSRADLQAREVCRVDLEAMLDPVPHLETEAPRALFPMLDRSVAGGMISLSFKPLVFAKNSRREWIRSSMGTNKPF